MPVRFPALGRLLGALLRDRSGVTAVFLAVSLVPVIGAVGLAVDSSIGYLLRTRMGKSLDAAGLAAGRMALDADAQAVAEQYFEANFGAAVGGGGNVTVTDFDFAVDPDANTVTVSAEATTPTVFMRIFGHDTMTVSARTVIQRETTGMELALVLDNTGSMWDSDTKTDVAGTPFAEMQDAALELIAIIYDKEAELDNVWVSLVPYVATVNVGSARTGWLAATDQVLTSATAFADEAWKGCVMARAYPYDGDDTTPAAAPFSSYRYPKAIDNDFPPVNSSYKATNQAAKGPNLACATEITPLTRSRTTIEAGIAAMKPWRRGGTAGNLGLAWGWRTISPGWRGLWGDAAMPLDYGTAFMEKVVVLLTDGNNEFYNLPYTVDSKTKKVTSPGDSSTPSDYTAYGRVNAPGPVGLGKSSLSEGREVLDTRMLETCTAMKAAGITLYTMTFGGKANAGTKALYSACATTPAMYYDAPDDAELSKAFRAIGGQLANLRILE